MTRHAPQSFDVKGGPEHGRAHLPLIRAGLKQAGLDGFIVPHEDEYNNEYLPDRAERLAWATGFTGSAGAAVILSGKAAVFADGRYTEQVREQVDAKLFEICGLPDPGPAKWLEDNAPKGARIGYDPRLHTPDALARFHAAADKAGAALVAVETNPIDAAWADQPPPPMARAVPHPVEYAGEGHGPKRTRIGAAIAKDGAEAVAVTDPASIAWLFNIRGGDVRRSPLALSAAILNADGTAALFIEPAKVGDDLRAHLGNEVAIRPEGEFAQGLAELSGKRVRVDPAASSAWVFDRLGEAGAEIVRGADPCALPRAAKNPVEIEGARKAHVRDGAAVTRFLHWLDTEAQSGEIDEIEAAVKLESFRAGLDSLRDLSFDTISGAGPNGALPHYRVSTASNRKLARGTLYLVDSGGQYPDGTTDITRTVPIGEPTAEMKIRFTLVLKGHIALSRVRFPKGTTGAQLDALARLPLWMAGLDYDHGTGHGVGSYLGVHEGPQRIAKVGSAVPLEPGMILSNEPGYYKPGEYGIRVENLQVVTAPAPLPGGEREMMGFETLTLAPIHRGLVDDALLTGEEREWLDAYHAQVRAKLAPLLDGETRTWLIRACEPLYGATP
ncbi:MAG: aminopeptidase P family protein [Maricaulaceae bacterium]|nr:aminopeptidase P family protein [Maricaulaceae bacterium]